MTKTTFTKCDISILIGNLLCHFDSALYGFLAPILAPIFFPGHDKIVQLILVYSFMATSVVTRPLGAFIFGMIAKNHTPMRAMSYSLRGMAIFALLMGFIPSYAQIGFYAPMMLLLVRFIKGIFTAGESAIVKLYILENKEYKAALRASYTYQASSIMGAICASAAAAAILWMDRPDLWRYCFIFGGLVGFAAYGLRYFDLAHKEHTLQISDISMSKSFLRNKIPMLTVAFTTGLSHMTYSIPCIVMNSLMPLIADVTLEEMMKLNVMLLIFDMVIIFTLGPILSRFNYMKVIIYSSVVIAITVPILLIFLPGGSIGYITFVRIWIVFWGVIFMCPQNLYYKKLFEHSKEKYILVAMSNAVGAGVIGHTIPALSMWIWYMSGSIWSIAGYVGAIGICTCLLIYVSECKNQDRIASC